MSIHGPIGVPHPESCGAYVRAILTAITDDLGEEIDAIAADVVAIKAALLGSPEETALSPAAWAAALQASPVGEMVGDYVKWRRRIGEHGLPWAGSADALHAELLDHYELVLRQDVPAGAPKTGDDLDAELAPLRPAFRAAEGITIARISQGRDALYVIEEAA